MYVSTAQKQAQAERLGLIADGLVRRNVHCFHCQYNLRMSDATGKCPECGHSVPASIWAHMQTWNPRWMTRLIIGAAMVSLGYFVIGLTLVSWESGLILGYVIVTVGLYHMIHQPPNAPFAGKSTHRSFFCMVVYYLWATCFLVPAITHINRAISASGQAHTWTTFLNTIASTILILASLLTWFCMCESYIYMADIAAALRMQRVKALSFIGFVCVIPFPMAWQMDRTGYLIVPYMALQALFWAIFCVALWQARWRMTEASV